MPNKPVLHMLMEVKARELEGRTLLALEAASRGFQVLLGNKTDIYNGIVAGFLPPGIFFDKSLTRGKEDYLKKVLKAGCQIVSQDEESGLLDFSYDRFLSVRSTPETVSMARALFCWGTHDYNSWVKHYPEAQKRIFATGSPRVDFWRSDFQKYAEKKIKSHRHKYGKFILISSNFPGVNGYMSRHELIENAKRIKSIKNEQEERERHQIFAEDQKMFDHFAELIIQLSEKFPEINFVIRPHPTEKISGWKQKLPIRNNIHVVSEGTINSWIRASMAILHNGCTSGIEAYVTDKPAIAYIPFESKRNREVPNQVSINCSSSEDVQLNLQEILEDKKFKSNVTEQNNELINSRLINVTYKPATQSIVDKLEEIDIDRYPIITRGLREWKIDLSIKYRKFKGKLIHKEIKSSRKFPALKPYEITTIQNKLGQFRQNYTKCRINHLYGDVCLITSQ